MCCGVAVGRRPLATRVYATARGRLDVLDPVTRQRVASTTARERGSAPVAVDPAHRRDLHRRPARRPAVPRGAGLSRTRRSGGTRWWPTARSGAALEAPRPGPGRAGAGATVPARTRGGHRRLRRGGRPARRTRTVGWAGRPAATAGGGARAARDCWATRRRIRRRSNGVPVTYFENGVTVTRLDPFGFPVNVVVTGAIWQRYQDGGDVSGGYGLPLGDEVPRPPAAATSSSSTPCCSIAATAPPRRWCGAGPVWDAWNAAHGGVGGPLGFPVADLGRDATSPTRASRRREWVPLRARRPRLERQHRRGVRAVRGVLAGLADARRRRRTPGPAACRARCRARTTRHRACRYVDLRTRRAGALPATIHPLRPAGRRLPCRQLAAAAHHRVHRPGVGRAGRSDAGPVHRPLAVGAVRRRRAARAVGGPAAGRGRQLGGGQRGALADHRPSRWRDRVRGDLAVNVAFHCWDFDDLGRRQARRDRDHLHRRQLLGPGPRRAGGALRRNRRGQLLRRSTG